MLITTIYSINSEKVRELSLNQDINTTEQEIPYLRLRFSSAKPQASACSAVKNY